MIRTDDASSNGAIPGQMLIGSTWGSVLHPWLVSRRSSWIVRPRPAPMLTTFASTSRHLADLVMSLMLCDMPCFDVFCDCYRFGSAKIAIARSWCTLYSTLINRGEKPRLKIPVAKYVEILPTIKQRGGPHHSICQWIAGNTWSPVLPS